MTTAVASTGLRAAVRLRRGDLRLDAEVDVGPGEVLAVLGPNGAGKTTLLRALAGLEAVDSGRIELAGRVLDDPAGRVLVAPEHRRVAVVFQDYLLFGHLSVLENVAFGLRARGTRRDEARRLAAEWLERVGLAARSGERPQRLSGGQQQRVALARALVADPALLLLDEPLAALDAATRRAMRSELRAHLDRYSQRGGVTLLVTHDPVDAYALADRVAVLDHGRVVQQGTIGEVTAYPRSSYVAELVGTNLFTGTCDGSTVRLRGGLGLSVVEAPVGEVFAIVRPQAVLLSRQAADGVSARNVWPGRVTEVVRLGGRARVSIELEASVSTSPPVMLVAEITVGALDSIGAAVGERLVASVKATEVEVYPA
jgi:molybdate transport system ATP-binding protein